MRPVAGYTGLRAAWTLRSSHTHNCPEDAWQYNPAPTLYARGLGPRTVTI
jgi:hypothetical protein